MSNFRFFRHPREDTNLHIYAQRRKKRGKKEEKRKGKKKRERPVEMLVITYNYVFAATVCVRVYDRRYSTRSRGERFA